LAGWACDARCAAHSAITLAHRASSCFILPACRAGHGTAIPDANFYILIRSILFFHS
ncbi:hypothetical protein HAX54_008371, partial [Datura stramonium]|nr:hypothetical protein [Datura stramonium]